MTIKAQKMETALLPSLLQEQRKSQKRISCVSGSFIMEKFIFAVSIHVGDMTAPSGGIFSYIKKNICRAGILQETREEIIPSGRRRKRNGRTVQQGSRNRTSA